MKLPEILPAADIEAEVEAAGGAVSQVLVEILRKTSLAGAVRGVSEFGQARQEQAAQLSKQEMTRQLQLLEVAAPLQARLLPLIQKWGCQLESAVGKHPLELPDCHYTLLRCNGSQTALVQLPPAVFATDGSKYPPHLPEFVLMIKAFRGLQTRFFAAGVEAAGFRFTAAFEDESRGADWKFIAWADITEMGNATLEYWSGFVLAKPGAGASGSQRSVTRPKVLDKAQLDIIVDALQRLITSSYASVEIGYRNLILDSEWPPEWKTARLQVLATTDAASLVMFMQAKGTFPAGHALPGHGVLGAFLARLLDRSMFGGDDANELARILVDRTLIPNADDYKHFIT